MDLVDMLNAVLEDYSDVRISQITGIERTRLNRIKNGKFKITIEELRKIVNSFMLSEEKAKELYDQYLYEKLGKDRYNSRLIAKEFLISLNTDESLGLFKNSILKTSLSEDFDISEDIVAINGAFSVRRALNYVMIQATTNKDKIRAISSPFSDYFLAQIFLITSSEPELEIDHIYSLSSINELTEPLTYYMSVAKAVYPIFMLNTGYNAYYTLVGHTTNALMPYCVITSNFFMMIAPDGTSAVITKAKSVIELQKKLFDERKKLCSSFIQRIRSTYSYLEYYCSIIEKSTASIGSGVYYSIDYEPCVLCFFKKEELEQCITNINNDEKLVSLFSQFVGSSYDSFRKNKQISFFTKAGLRSFIETGTIAEIPDSIGLVLSSERRKEVLQRVLDKMKEENCNKIYYLLNENEFAPPLGLRFLGSGTKTDHLFVISNRYGDGKSILSFEDDSKSKEATHSPDITSSGFRSILRFSNPEITAAVYDFVVSLHDTNMVYSKEKMIEYMERTIAEM